MSLRHAAALALVGWYLIVPPFHVEGERPVIDSNVPTSNWTILNWFGTFFDCEKERERFPELAIFEALTFPSTAEANLVLARVPYAQCVSTKDLSLAN
jgi:hypothetical protein